MLRTDRGPLRAVWALLYELTARGVARLLCRGETGAAAYLRGSAATGTAVHGLSDIDLVLVLEDERAGSHEGRNRVIRRWRRLLRLLPPLEGLLTIYVYMWDELETVSRSPAPTFDLESNRPEPLFNRGPGFDDPLWIRARPGLDAATAGWRRLRGSDRKPPSVSRTPAEGAIAVWLELGWWWRHAIAASLSAPRPHTPHLMVKLISEPVKMLLWLQRRELFDERRAALKRGLEAFPDEQDAIQTALALLDSLPRNPGVELSAVLPALARLSSRIGAELRNSLEAEGRQPVRLVGGVGGDGMALADWRAVVLADPAEERFQATVADAGDPGAIARGSRSAGPPGVWPALRDGQLLVLPLRDVWPGGVLRTLQFPFTDPVSFALLDGSRSASFSRAPGLAPADWAARALAEHRPRLADPPQDSESRLRLALTAARAALLAESTDAGDPVLALTPADTAELLAEHDGPLRTLAADACAWLARPEDAPAPALADELLAAVALLPPFADRSPSSSAAAPAGRR